VTQRPTFPAPARAFAAGLLCALLAACAGSPPARHYTLGPLPAAAAAAVTDDRSLVVGPVTLPAAIDRLQMVRITDGARADISDSHRWAGRLKTEIALRLAGDIARESGLGRVVAWPQASIVDPDMTVRIDVQRFDAEGFQRVTLEAVWTLRRAGQDVGGARFVASEAPAAASYDALAAAHGRLVDALARDIVRALPPAR
jgi:uncharacterized protein